MKIQHPDMKLLRSHLLWLVCTAGAQLALLAFALPMPDARSAERPSRVMGDVQAKLAYCEDCHGRSAQGFHGYFPIPRLAGQQPEYMKNQLEAFVEHRRTNNIMFNVAHELSPAMLDALTESFQKLNPKPLTTSAAEGLIAAGKTIYEEGLPKSDVPPCAGCHGSEAK